MATFRAESRTLIAELERHGVSDARLEHGGKHPRILWTWRGQAMRHVLPSSSSDTRGLENGIHEIRRQLGVVKRERSTGTRRRKRQRNRVEQVECPRLTVAPDPWRVLRRLRPTRRERLADVLRRAMRQYLEAVG